MCNFPKLALIIQLDQDKKKTIFQCDEVEINHALNIYRKNFNLQHSMKFLKAMIGCEVHYHGERVKVLNVVQLPCGHCIECIRDKSEEYSTRIMLYIKERGMRNYNDAFITLTYAELKDNSLHKEELQKFFKRLRKKGVEFKYLACGEYGSETLRPHYHFIFIDTKGISQPELMKNLHESWIEGQINIDWAINEKTINYVARYCDKKLEEELTKNDYEKAGLEAPFILISKGIGKEQLIKQKEKIIELGYIQKAEGKKGKVPRYFTKILNEEEAEQVKKNKQELAENQLAYKLQQARALNYRVEEIGKLKEEQQRRAKASLRRNKI